MRTRLVRINSTTGEGSYALHDVTLTDGEKEWNAHLDAKSLAIQKAEDQIALLLNSEYNTVIETDVEQVFSLIGDIRSLSWSQGQDNALEAQE